eukprot:scaffold16774_cov131-Skeletonema_marinoi.AAC.1
MMHYLFPLIDIERKRRRVSARFVTICSHPLSVSMSSEIHPLMMLIHLGIQGRARDPGNGSGRIASMFMPLLRLLLLHLGSDMDEGDSCIIRADSLW